MRIYHYTTLDALALILKNKTIHFSRLDKVDDFQESNLSSKNINIGHYAFASCWTYDGEENIPLWNMYTGRERKGVRLAMEHDMFERHPLKSEKYNGMYSCFNEKTESFIPIEKMVTEDYIVFPSPIDSDSFFKRVEYRDDFAKVANEIIRFDNYKAGQNAIDATADITIKVRDFGRYKSKMWEFQKECRFVIAIFPYESQNPYGDALLSALQSLYENKRLPIECYDLEVKDDAFNSLDIMLAPKCTEADRIIVESLASRYAPNTKIEMSKYG